MLSVSLTNRRSICSSLKETGWSMPGHSLTAGTGTMVRLGSCFLDSACLSWLRSRDSSMRCAIGMRASRSKTLPVRPLTPWMALEIPACRALAPLDVKTLLLTSDSRKTPNANRLMREARDSKFTLARKRSHSLCCARASASAFRGSAATSMLGSPGGTASAAGPSLAITGGRHSEDPGLRWLVTILPLLQQNRIFAPSDRYASHCQPSCRSSLTKVNFNSPKTSVTYFPLTSLASRSTCL
mmetsp:Transcript_105922/g.326897  ORF Transcript_105922/g.326897 Transcript_105922/m.326897 type:complete len:241 (+) Transcript_105922:2010-2732(+)